MDELLAPLHEESYAHVDEVKGDAYGFGGLTQERRYIAGKLEVAAKGGVTLKLSLPAGARWWRRTPRRRPAGAQRRGLPS